MAESNASSGIRPDEREEHNATAENLAVNRDVSISCESEYKDYKYNEKVDIWTLVSLKAPQEEENEDNKRAPIDLVAVIDKSGSMSGLKLDLVKKTLQFVLTQLNENDRLSVVSYDTNVNLEFALKNLDDKGKEMALSKIEDINSGSMTNLSGGLMKGLCQMIDRKEKNEVASVLLFTDGLANHGITNADGIVAAMKNPKRFEGVSGNNSRTTTRGPPQQPQPQLKPQAHQGWLRNIFGSNQKPNVEQQQTPVPVPEPEVEAEPVPETIATSSGADEKSTVTVYTFGFGSDHDPTMLTKISEAGNGMYYFIENEDKIAESFAHCLGGLMSTAAQGIQLQIDLEDGVHIKDVHTAKSFEKFNNDRSIKVDMGDLQAEEKRDIVLELTLDPVPQPYNATPQPILKAQVDYFNVLTNDLGTGNATLAVLRSEAPEPRNEKNMHREVGKQKARVRVTDVMKRSKCAADAGNFEDARRQMREELDLVRATEELATDGEERDYYGAMSRDLESCSANFDSYTAYSNRGTKLQLNLVQQYGAQRSSNLSSDAFVTKGRKKQQSAAKSFFKKK